jgi:Gnt-I system low-affinity gluconate transporter
MSFLLAQGPLPVGSLIALLIFGIAVLLVMILRFKLQAFLALLIASIVVAAGAVFVNGKVDKTSIEFATSTAVAVTIVAPDHGRSAGAKITINGCEPGGYNGKWTVASVPDAGSLTLNYKEPLAADQVPGALVKAGSMANSYAISLTQIGGTIVNGMGGALGFIATIIGIGAIFGALLEHSGGTQSLARWMLGKLGVERAPWAMLLTGFVISVPVFLDVALVILAPLLYALARDTKKPLLVFGLPLVVGMAVTHAFVPPTPGPVAVGYILGVNLGWVIAFGVLVGLPTAIICGPWLCSRIAARVDVPLPDHVPQVTEDEVELPSFGMIFGLIALPIILILASTIVEQVVAGSLDPTLSNSARKGALVAALASSSPGLQIVHFVGHPVISLLMATLLAVYFLGAKRGASKEQLVELCTKALGPAGIIILITGAGGVFKGVLIATGIAEALADAFGGSGIPTIVLAYIFATLVRVAQGSATVAMLTAAGLMVGFVEGMSQPQLALITVAIAAGATGFSHVNDSGFWMISRYMGMSEKQTLKTWTIVSTAISLVSFAIILLVSLFVESNR